MPPISLSGSSWSRALPRGMSVLAGLRGGSMKKAGFAMLVISLLAGAQQPPPRPVQGTRLAVAAQPSPFDLYCSGFITTEKVPETHYVVGGLGSPEQTEFALANDNIFIHGQGIKEGDRLEFLRHVKDPNRSEEHTSELQSP